jgi:Flp pilus assembly protein TadD
VIQPAQQHAAANPELLVQLGYALIESGQYQQSVDSFDRAMAVRHQYADAYNGKAVAFDHTGNHLIAQQLYRQALGFSPDATNIQNNLALSLIMDGKAAEAVALLEPVYAQHPDHKTLRQNLAMAYGVSGNSAKAMELNMLSLTKEEAEENQRYYKEFAKRKLKTPKLASKLKPATVAEKKPAVAIEQKPAIAMAPAAEAAPVVQAAPQPITPLVEPAQKAETETKVEEASPAAGGEEAAKTDDKTDAEEESIFTFKPIYPGAPRN